MAGPLEGLRVLDATQMLAGPICGMRLGDLGADVVKIEPPGTGEWTRTHGFANAEISGHTTAQLGLNRNKRSVTINLKSPAGQSQYLKICVCSVIFSSLCMDGLRRQCDVLKQDGYRQVIRCRGLGQRLEARHGAPPDARHAAQQRADQRRITHQQLGDGQVAQRARVEIAACIPSIHVAFSIGQAASRVVALTQIRGRWTSARPTRRRAR